MTDEYQPQDLLTITDLETLKVVSDPLRIQILELFTTEPQTVKQVAQKLGLSPHKLYYHVNLLEKHDLLRVVDTRVVSGIIEKHYQVTAKTFDVHHDLLAFNSDEGKQNLNTIVTTIIDSTRDDIARSLEARTFELEHGADEHPRQFLLNRVMARIPDERANEFIERFKAMMTEFEDSDEALASNHPYALTVALYPSFYYHTHGEADGTDDS